MTSFSGSCEAIGNRWRVRIVPPPGFDGARTEWRWTDKGVRKLLDRRLGEAEKRIHASVQAVIDECRSGKKLCIANRVTDAGTVETIWFFEPGGKGCGAGAARRAIEAGFLRPLGGGLIDESFSQSWTLA